MQNNIKARITFFAALFFTIFPVMFFPLLSYFVDNNNDIPSVTDGVLSLKGYDFNNIKEIPLNGEWEFYWDKFIVSDNIDNAKPDFNITVPKTWYSYSIDGKKLPSQGKASYKITITDYPKDANLTLYIPNITAPYKVFINGENICSNQELSKESLGYIKGDDDKVDIVVEIECKYIGGIYITPMLRECSYNSSLSNIRFSIAAIYLGMIIMAMLWYVFILFFRDTSINSIALLILDLIVFFRVVGKNEFYKILSIFFGKLELYAMNSVLQVLTLFLPAIFLLCAGELLKLKINRSRIFKVVVYEFVIAIFILYFSFEGRIKIQHSLCIISYIPFSLVIMRLYENVKIGIKYSLMVSIMIMLIISAIIVSNMVWCGMLIKNVSLYSPTCIVLSMMLQDYIYIRKNIDIQKEAFEAEKLRKNLKESEMDLMLSQIKPHFLYNTLTAIHMLCTEDPQLASETVMKFADFLRTNMRYISSKEAIPFLHELEHIKNYAAIEKLRFQDRLTIIYEISATDFKVPPLTIQPLVENAIKHGACKNVEGGTVTLRAFEDNSCCYIIVSDNGSGFDTEILNYENKESNGIKNISFRLKNIVNGSVEIYSQIGKGTDVVVTISKGDF